MKKLFILLAAVLSLAACGDKASQEDNIPTDGLLGADAPELYKLMYEAGKSLHGVDSVKMIAAWYGHGNDSEQFKKAKEETLPEYQAQNEEICSKVDAKIDEIIPKIVGKTVKVTFEKGIPAKIVEPFKITEAYKSGYHGLSYTVAGVVQFTQKLRFAENAMLAFDGHKTFDAKCYDDKDTLIGERFLFVDFGFKSSIHDEEAPIGQNVAFKISFHTDAQHTYKQGEDIDSTYWVTNRLEICHNEALSEFVSGEQAVDRPFTLTKTKIGGSHDISSYVSVNALVQNLDQSVDGLYDSFKKESETMMDEDGEWTNTFLQFYKGGKKVFKAYLSDEGRVGTIELQPASSSIIRNSKDIYVGYPARKLFDKLKGAQWDNYYRGEVFATKDGFTYYIDSDALINTDIPEKATDFKADAKVKGITNVVN